MASTFTFRVTLREGFNNLHKGFWEDTGLIVYCTLKERKKEQEEEVHKEEEANDQKMSEQMNYVSEDGVIGDWWLDKVMI